MAKKKKPVTNKVVDNQEIKDVMIDVEAGIVKVGIEFSKETAMPADPPRHPNSYTLINNRLKVYHPIKAADVQIELDALIDKIDTLV